MTASARGDVRAFGSLVERHHGAVVAVAFAITRDLALSEDIAQETFVVAWTRLGDVLDPSRVRAWLCNIARNRSKNELRRRKREAGEPDDNIVDGAPSPADTMLAHESHAQVLAALAEVPANYREPLVLFYWHEQSIESVASALSISAQAAQKRISRARSFVHEGLVARMQELGRERRPAKAAAVAIVAMLATRAAPAGAATHLAAATSGATKWLLLLAAVVSTGLAIGVVAWQRAARSNDAAAASLNGTAALGSGRAAAGAAHQAARPVQLPGSGADKKDAPIKGGFGTPEAYELTELGPTSVAVNLAGGASSVFLWDTPTAPAFSRHVRGRVLDEAGKPLAGAVVLIGASIRTSFGSMTADHGATTDHAGGFDVLVRSEAAGSAVALHARAGWSSEVAVAAGRADAEIEIRIVRPGTIRGAVSRGRSPIAGKVRITRGALDLDLETDDQGRFEVPLLAPGTYRVAATPDQLFAGGTTKAVEHDVRVESGKTATMAFEIAPATLVVVTLADERELGTVEYFLLPRSEAALDSATLRKLARSGGALSTLFGGSDIDRPMQFHDVQPGAYTLCVDRRIDRETPLPLICQKLDVAGELVEVAVAGT